MTWMQLLVAMGVYSFWQWVTAVGRHQDFDRLQITLAKCGDEVCEWLEKIWRDGLD